MPQTDSSAAATQTNDTVVIERVFDAPRELVWRAWTEPEHFMRWWGPKDFTSPRCEIDLRVGGAFLWCMRGPDGRENYTTGQYREIVPFERLAYMTSFADPDGNVVPASYYGMTDDIAPEMHVTVTFAEIEGKTRMTVTHAGLPKELGDDAQAGWNQSFDKLAESLK